MDDATLILLTYKNKALLMYKYENSIDKKEHEWTLIKTPLNEKKAIKESIRQSVHKEAGILLESITYLSDNYYHAKLTDKNVNNIKRHEFQLLNFFTINEINNLNLSPASEKFIKKYHELI